MKIITVCGSYKFKSTMGRSVLKQFYDAGAIKNVDYGADFAVDRSLSKGDSTYFNVALEPVDSSEKLYFTIKTR